MAAPGAPVNLKEVLSVRSFTEPAIVAVDRRINLCQDAVPIQAFRLSIAFLKTLYNHILCSLFAASFIGHPAEFHYLYECNSGVLKVYLR
jgi:hypothetical protein